MKPVKRKKFDSIIIIDVANLAYIAYYASNKYYIWKKEEKPVLNTLIVHMMLTTILSLYEWYKPNQIFAVFEGDKKENPRFSNPLYKANRPSNESVDLTQELILFRNILTIMGILVIIPAKGEADDGIGHITRKLAKNTKKIYILSKDHDMKYLLKYKNVKILHKFRGDKEYVRRYTHKHFIREFNFDPKYFSLFLAITGDTSDNIPGVRGYGEKRTIKIFNELQEKKLEINIDNIASSIYKSKKTRLTENSIKEQINMCYNLTKLHTDWPITITTTILKKDKIEEAFIKLEFKTLLKSLDKIFTMCEHFFKNHEKVMTASA